MADLSTSIARLIAELTRPETAHIAPKQALAEVWEALDQLNLNPGATQQLRAQIDEAKLAGLPHLNGTPLYLLEAMLQNLESHGGPDHD